MSRFLTIAVTSIAMLVLFSSTSLALSPFKKSFDEKYVKNSGDAEFQTAFRKQGCYVCHVKGQKKEFVNAYGHELAKLIEGNAKERLDAARKNGKAAQKAEEEKILEELKAVFTKVETVKSPDGVTYGEMFKSHKLPALEGKKFSTK